MAVTAIVVIVTLGGSYWAVSSYSRAQESRHQTKIDQLRSEIDDIHDQIDDLKNWIESLRYRIHRASLKAAVLRYRLRVLGREDLRDIVGSTTQVDPIYERPPQEVEGL